MGEEGLSDAETGEKIRPARQPDGQGREKEVNL